MAVQIRSKRKKNFKSNEEMQVDESATESRGVDENFEKDVESNLNIRRSSRKPKPKKLSDDFEEDIPIEIKQEPLDIYEDTPTVYMTETPVFDTGEPSDRAVSFLNPSSSSLRRRETRKSFQSYLETLGYNRDFSKIPEDEQYSESWQISGKYSGKKTRVTVKPEPEENFTQAWPLPNEETTFSEFSLSDIRASSRTPKPKKTVNLVEAGANTITGLDSQESIDRQLNQAPKETKKRAPKKVKTGKSASGRETVKTKERYPSKASKELHNECAFERENDVDERDIMSDETDGTPTRTSGRVRVPKRQFSLLEVETQHDAKRQKMMSPEHIASPEVKKGKHKENFSVRLSENKEAAQSSIIVKRSNVRKTQGKNKKEKTGNTLDSCPGKVKKILEDINIKREVDTTLTTESSQSETEKKTVVKKGRDRIEKIVDALKLAKQTDLVSTQEEKPKEKTLIEKKGVKRKRESNGEVKKSGKGSGGKKVKKTSENEHIVLKLSIPHGKKKEKTKKDGDRHHHKHHHKPKKTKDGETIVRKQKKKSTAVKNSKKNKTNVPAKKKVVKKKLNIKKELEDSSSHPHVKLIIKKSPLKATKIAEVMMQDTSGECSSEYTAGSSREVLGNKPNIKKKLPSKKKYKPLTKQKPLTPKTFKKKKDKTMKSRTVSAYSLFTKNRRKGLLEKEPDLDFASTSRRLAEMWKNLPDADQEYWKAKARAVRMPNGRDPTRSFLRTRRGRYDSYNWSHFSDVAPSSSGTEAIDMAAYLKLLGESLCSIGMCLKRQDQMEVHGSLSVLLDTALCSIVPIFCLTSQLPMMAGCSPATQAQMLDNLAYIIPGL